NIAGGLLSASRIALYSKSRRKQATLHSVPLTRAWANWKAPSACSDAAQLVVEIGGPPLLFPPAEPAAASRICTASRRLHRHYRMRRKRRAARRRPPSGGPQFNVKTLAGLTLHRAPRFDFGPIETCALRPQ